MKLIWKLLRQNISKGQLIGFALANFLGMAILLLAVQFYSDVNPIFSNKDGLFKKDYFIVTKKVGLLSIFTSNTTAFSAEEVRELKEADFVKEAGAFVSSQYSVNAGISYPSKGINFNTQMFFESVPQTFIDVKTDEWKFTPIDNAVPIILPKNYLDLYNFGFAESKAMPKISEDLIKMVKFDITIAGNGQTKQLRGNIVGFSNRINTILVPESFMTWANTNYGNGSNQNPSRLIIEVNDITNPNISKFFKEKGYEVGNDNTTTSKVSFLLKVLISIVAIIGLVICGLSFFILSLSIYLLLEKNMEKLQNLRLLGYEKSKITRPYELLAIITNAITLLLALAVVFVSKMKYSKVLERIWSDFESSGMLNTILVGSSIWVILSAVNIWTIRRRVK